MSERFSLLSGVSLAPTPTVISSVCAKLFGASPMRARANSRPWSRKASSEVLRSLCSTPLLFSSGQQRYHLGDRGRKAVRCGGLVGMMDEPRAQIALVGGIARLHLLVALVELPQLPLRGVFLHPRQPRECQRRLPRRQHQLQALIQPPPAGLRSTCVEPQYAHRQRAVDRHRRLILIDADHGPGLLALHQRTASVGWAEALLEVHRGAKALGLPVLEGA